MPVATGCQHIDQRLGRIGVVADDEPAKAVAGLGARDRCAGLFPTELVAIIDDRLRRPLPIVLGREPAEHLQGAVVAVCAVEKGGEFFELTVFEQTDGLGAGSAVVLWLAGLAPVIGQTGTAVVREPVLAMFERIGGKVQLLRLRLPECGEIR